MRPSECKKVAQCVADMVNTKIPHNIRHVPLVLCELVQEHLKTYVPETDIKPGIIESGIMNNGDS